MVREQGRSGWTIYDVLDQRLTCSTVVTEAGVITTVDITRMFLSAAAKVMYRIIRRRTACLMLKGKRNVFTSRLNL